MGFNGMEYKQNSPKLWHGFYVLFMLCAAKCYWSRKYGFTNTEAKAVQILASNIFGVRNHIIDSNQWHPINTSQYHQAFCFKVWEYLIYAATIVAGCKILFIITLIITLFWGKHTKISRRRVCAIWVVPAISVGHLVLWIVNSFCRRLHEHIWIFLHPLSPPGIYTAIILSGPYSLRESVGSTFWTRLVLSRS